MTVKLSSIISVGIYPKIICDNLWKVRQVPVDLLNCIKYSISAVRIKENKVDKMRFGRIYIANLNTKSIKDRFLKKTFWKFY